MVAVVGGVLVALVTPVDDTGAVDEPAVERIVKRALDAGVTGVSPIGTTGEGARLTRAERARIVAAVRRTTAGPVVPGLFVTTLADAASELAELAGLGADAALVAPPSYFPAGDAEVERLFTHLADAAPIPLLLYNIPALTKTAIAPRVVGRLAAHPQIAGIKDSSRDFEYLQAVLYATEGADFRVLTGSDTMLLASLLLGAQGTIAASANLVPGLGVELYAKVRDGQLDKARLVQRRLFEIVQACRRGAPPVGWKAAMQVAGLCSGRPVGTALPLAEQACRELAEDLARLAPEIVKPDG